MYRFTSKQYADKVSRYRLKTQRAHVCMCTRTYTRTHTHAHLRKLRTIKKPYPSVSTRWVLASFIVLACLVRAHALIKEDAPRWSTADVYDRDLR